MGAVHTSKKPESELDRQSRIRLCCFSYVFHISSYAKTVPEEPADDAFAVL